MAAGGAVLVAMGLLIWTGELFRLNIEAQRLLDELGLNFFNDV
jgi:cytochrome c-type biogenesis protein